jgi:hypothetical protein
MAKPDQVQPGESSITLPKGKAVFPAHPAECTYIRVLDENDKEIGYWDVNEWEEEPTEVMGAIMGCIKSRTAN